MTSAMKLENRTAVITGAASGIGRAIAVSLARRGCNLALADVNDAGLSETARMAQSAQPHPASATPSTAVLRVSQHHLDVADRRAVAGFPQAVIAAHPGVDILVNNAGVAIGGTFEAVSEEDFEWVLEINFWGVVRMTRAFLPLLQKSDDARLVNLSSIYGIISPPGQSPYSASKFAVRGFSNSLLYELAGSKVGVTVVHPGGIATSIADKCPSSQGHVSGRSRHAQSHCEKSAADAARSRRRNHRQGYRTTLAAYPGRQRRKVFGLPRTPRSKLILENLQPDASEVVIAGPTRLSRMFAFWNERRLTRSSRKNVSPPSSRFCRNSLACLYPY
jgi:NAD(P)-dependent dehydrogenase (short-subunit alcohol dehydrogenase family)